MRGGYWTSICSVSNQIKYPLPPIDDAHLIRYDEKTLRSANIRETRKSSSKLSHFIRHLRQMNKTYFTASVCAVHREARPDKNAGTPTGLDLRRARIVKGQILWRQDRRKPLNESIRQLNLRPSLSPVYRRKIAVGRPCGVGKAEPSCTSRSRWDATRNTDSRVETRFFIICGL